MKSLGAMSKSGTTGSNAIAPVVKPASNNRVFERMSGDIDISAGDIIEGAATIDAVGERFFEHIKKVSSGEIPGKAEISKHREFQFRSEQTVTL